MPPSLGENREAFSMPRFFCETIGDGQTVLAGEDGRHIAKALRCRVGENLTLCDGRGSDYPCTIREIAGDVVTLTVGLPQPSRSEPPVEITLYQASPKADKAELIVQKAVELGVHRVVFIDTARCVARPDAKSVPKKLERLQRIAEEAAKQSGRGIIPRVEGWLSWPQTVAQLADYPAVVLFYEQATQPLPQVLAPRPSRLAILVGSEGGWEPAEVAEAQAVGAASCTMGPRILRCETAPLWALSAILYEYEQR